MHIQSVDSCNCGLLATNLVKLHFLLTITHAERQMDTICILLLCALCLSTQNNCFII